jgi:hypothetical protein
MNNTEKPAHPQPVMQVKITAMSDGNVNVNGFPTNLSAAMQILSSATQAIVSHFMSEAKAGNVDEAGTIIPKKIIEPQKPALVGADGRPVQ